MADILWVEAVRKAWSCYIDRMNSIIQAKSMETYLMQTIEPGITLEEFAESVFIAGFIAGEKFSRNQVAAGSDLESRLN
ncbi:MAG: hypothetical protein HGB20_01960 [Chlorobiaceae bacterium]|nr:hypothetical protein [Chlorobiaceae bacterium]